MTPAKSKTLGAINIPDKYLRDILRGLLDGDGYTYSYWDKRWKSSFMLYFGFVSASIIHLEWIQGKVLLMSGLKGVIKKNNQIYSLQYAKHSSIGLVKIIY